MLLRSSVTAVAMTVAAVLLSAIAGAAQSSTTVVPPRPATLFHVSPIELHPGAPSPITPTCPPLIVSRGAAFLCFMGDSGESSVQFVSPTAPEQYFTGSIIRTEGGEAFRQQPTALTEASALVAVSTAENSFWALTSATRVIWKNDRRGSTAYVACSVDRDIGFIPIGDPNATSPRNELLAVNLSATTEDELPIWREQFTLPSGDVGRTAMQTPVYYDGNVFVMQSNTLYKLAVAKSNRGTQVIQSISNPCGIVPAPGHYIHMRVVQIGEDANGPLNAFLAFANVTYGAGTGPALAVCRFSHFDLRPKWPGGFTVYDADVHVEDIAAGNGVVLISGSIANVHDKARSYVLLALSAETGDHMYTINRHEVDRRSFPLLLPNATNGCDSSFVAQIEGNLTAFCSLDGRFSWVSPHQCNERPVWAQLPTSASGEAGGEVIVCSEQRKSVQLLNLGDGSLRWLQPVEVVHMPAFVDDAVWAIDVDTNLYGYSVSAFDPPPPPPPDGPSGAKKRLTPGEVVLIVFIFAFVIGIGAGVAFSWVKRSRRRDAYSATVDQDGYGSLSGSA